MRPHNDKRREGGQLLRLAHFGCSSSQLSEVGAIASRAIKQDANSALRPEHFSCTVAGTGHLMQAMRDA
jgi:hypothetical protein